jgi:hypothetical protein
MSSEPVQRALRLAHGIITAAWFLGVYIWYDRSVWFMSGGLGFTYLTAMAVWLVPVVRRAQFEAAARANNTPRPVVPFVYSGLALGIVVTSVLGILAVLLYIALLASAIVWPTLGESPAMAQLIAQEWNDERALVAIVFGMQSATVVLHVVDLFVYARFMAKK